MLWTNLPAEIRVQIIRHLDRDSLKSFRLTSKDNARVSTPKLFSTVHLTLSTHSFNRASQISTSEELAHHVKEVVLHIGVLEDVHNGFQAFRDDMLRLHRPTGSTHKITGDILWKYNCFLEEIEGQREFLEERSEAIEMNLLCQPFGALTSISMLLDEDDPFKPPTDYIGRRTGSHSTCSAIGDHFSSLFHAAAGRVLSKIDCSSVSWSCLPMVVIDEYFLGRDELRSLEQLSLSFFNSEFLDFDSKDQENVRSAFSTILETTSFTSKLRYLHLDFDELPLDYLTVELLSISSTIFEFSWPRLTRLDLMGVVVDEDDMVDFLGKHASSLKHVHLDDIEIVAVSRSLDPGPEGGLVEEYNTASIIRLFDRISRTLNLESASLSGTFTNRETEMWYVNVDVNEETCLRSRIEKWLCQKGPSPLPEEIALSYVENGGRTSPQPHYTVEFFFEGKDSELKIEDFSDESWKWCRPSNY